MKATLSRKIVQLWRSDFLSPKDLIRRALVILALLTIAHLAGLREFTSVLNGTAGSIALNWKMSVFLGLTYVVLYLAAVLLVPIFLLAAALLTLWFRFFSIPSIPAKTQDEPRTKTTAPDPLRHLALHNRSRD